MERCVRVSTVIDDGGFSALGFSVDCVEETRCDSFSCDGCSWWR